MTGPLARCFPGSSHAWVLCKLHAAAECAGFGSSWRGRKWEEWLCEGGLERKAAGLGQTGAKGGFIEEALPSRLLEIVD